MVVRNYKIHILWWRISSRNYHNVYGQQTSQGGDVPRAAPTYKFAWSLIRVTLWNYVSNKLHISTCRRPMDTKLGNCKVLTCYGKLPPLKPHDFFITWPIWGHVTIWKICISYFTRHLATKLGRGRVLTSGKRFSTQTFKSSPTSCLYWRH